MIRQLARRAAWAMLAVVLAAPAPAQQSPTAEAAQQSPGPPAAQPSQSPPAFAAFLPQLPPSVVPPRLEASYPCRAPHAIVYEHPNGPTVLTFMVTAQGHVANLAVAQSSGSASADEAARECIANWVYAPALHDGLPVDQGWATQYRFWVGTSHLPLTRPPPGVGGNFVMMPVEKYSLAVSACERWHSDAAHGVLVAFDVEPDGSVKNASVAETSGDAGEDKDALDCVGHRAYRPGTRNGEPVEVRLTAELFNR